MNSYIKTGHHSYHTDISTAHLILTHRIIRNSNSEFELRVTLSQILVRKGECREHAVRCQETTCTQRDSSISRSPAPALRPLA